MHIGNVRTFLVLSSHDLWCSCMQKKFKRLDQANGISAQGIRISLPKASLQSGAVPETSKALAQVRTHPCRYSAKTGILGGSSA